MKKRILYWALMVALTLLLAGPQAMAKGKGQKGNAGTPSGWEKGEKKGWESDAPPKHDKEATEGISEKAEEKTKKAKESKERTRKEGEDAKKSMEKERERARESEEK